MDIKENTVEAASGRSERFSEATRYAHATVDYAGLVVWSVISRSSKAIKDSTLAMVMPIARNVCAPFGKIKDKMSAILGAKGYDDDKITDIIERIRTLEERLIFLEKHGVRLAGEPEYRTKKKELDEERKGLLDLIVEENKELRKMLNV